jgi:hypothetical protein
MEVIKDITDSKDSFILNIEAGLKEEATQYYNLRKEYRRQRYVETYDSYIISRKWLNKWKEYINYRYLKRYIQYSYYYSQHTGTQKYDPKPDSFPGEIDNTSLLVSLEKFLNNGDFNDHENFILTQNIDHRKQIKIVNSTIWDFFRSRYGGGPEIKKEVIEELSRYSSIQRKVIEINYKKYNIITFPKREDLSDDIFNEMKASIIYISKSKTIQELKSKYVSLVKYIGTPYYTDTVEINNLRLWRIDYSIKDLNLEAKINIFRERLKKYLKGNYNEINKCNNVIDFEGITYMEYAPNLKLSEAEISDDDLIFFEYSTDSSPFLFEVEEKEMKEGKCDWCNSRKFLTYVCQCKSAWYCTNGCMEKDKNFHERSCTIFKNSREAND